MIVCVLFILFQLILNNHLRFLISYRGKNVSKIRKMPILSDLRSIYWKYEIRDRRKCKQTLHDWIQIAIIRIIYQAKRLSINHDWWIYNSDLLRNHRLNLLNWFCLLFLCLFRFWFDFCSWFCWFGLRFLLIFFFLFLLSHCDSSSFGFRVKFL